ncbi:hypothetical protein HQ535_03685 [bacterium]|nr:hypothetical protein [bacterium]
MNMDAIKTSRSTMVVAGGALLVILGSFLTWVSIDIGGQTISSSGTGEGGDGTLTLILAIAAVALAVFLLGKGTARKIAVAIAAALILLIAIIDVQDIMSGGDLGIDASVGIGLWLVVVGGVVALAGAFIKDA